MPFKTILRELVESTPGGAGAILADWEGEAVEQYCHFDEFEMKVIGAHKGIILGLLRKLHADLALGDVEDLVITTGAQRHIVAPVGPDYVVVLTMSRSAVPALALREVRSAVKLLNKEIY